MGGKFINFGEIEGMHIGIGICIICLREWTPLSTRSLLDTSGKFGNHDHCAPMVVWIFKAMTMIVGLHAKFLTVNWGPVDIYDINTGC